MAKDKRNQPPPAGASEQIEYADPQGCLLRLFWMAGGNFALLVVALLMSQQRTFSWVDIAYWAIVICIGAARYIDIARFKGETSDGAPATMEHFRAFLVRLLAVTGALWAGIHFVPGLF